jgi:UDP-N-acetyl-D-mannosaminuronate dehydrogenase
LTVHSVASPEGSDFMKKETVLIVGLGEVGQVLFDLFTENHKFEVHGFDVDNRKMQVVADERTLFRNPDVMHICYPCTDQEKFIKTTLQYIKKAKPRLTIVESTVPPTTTHRIYESSKAPIVNSPIRGMHKSIETMKRDIQFWRKYVGGATKQSAAAARRHFQKLGLRTRVLKSPTETELAKLFETIYRAWMIASFQEMHRITRHFGADFDEVAGFIEDTHRADLNKPLHHPNVIGGHCLIPNTELLLKYYSSDFLRLILKSNEKRKIEITDPIVRTEVEKVRKRVKKLEKEARARSRRDQKRG